MNVWRTRCLFTSSRFVHVCLLSFSCSDLSNILLLAQLLLLLSLPFEISQLHLFEWIDTHVLLWCSWLILTALLIVARILIVSTTFLFSSMVLFMRCWWCNSTTAPIVVIIISIWVRLRLLRLLVLRALSWIFGLFSATFSLLWLWIVAVILLFVSLTPIMILIGALLCGSCLWLLLLGLAIIFTILHGVFFYNENQLL